MGVVQTTPEFKVTFRILRTCYIGTIKRRFFNGEEYKSHDYGEVEQLRKCVSAMEIPNEEEAGPEETAEETAPAEEETAEETEARLRGTMMDEIRMPWEELRALAKKNKVRHVGVKRAKIVDRILATTAEG